MKQPISIVGASFISPLGQTSDETWQSYLSPSSFLKQKLVNDVPYFVGRLTRTTHKELDKIRAENIKYKDLDPSVLMAIFVAREAAKEANWSTQTFGVNLGSSRGATHLFESYHQIFIETQKAQTLTSPTTTLGNISSWVANDLQNDGPTLSHSITCSTGLHAVLNGIAWLQAGMVDHFMVGASEAPLTPFTLAQMAALKIYTRADQNDTFPCKAMDFHKSQNTMALAEGAGILCLTNSPQPQQNVIARILGMGYATELLSHGTSISTNGICFQKSMEMALKGIDSSKVDAVILHTPGTIQGDLAELNALKKVFPNDLPFMTNNKWKIGHTFASSGILSMEMALEMIKRKHYLEVPYLSQNVPNSPPKLILVNAVGFGGNAVSILVGE
ncbi:beta-ketoacyl synthase [Flavobacteriaceae bacterium F08102]|nr:beta-ketoacyl synthase [Flavobacteriaceae bacterium F08102]